MVRPSKKFDVYKWCTEINRKNSEESITNDKDQVSKWEKRGWER